MLKSGNRSVFSASSYLAAALAGLFALELLFALESPDGAPPPSAIAVQAEGAPLGNAGDPLQSSLSAWRAAVLARPLFDPSRRPPAAFSQIIARPEVPRLSGIMITPTEKIAVFSPAMGSPIIVAENSQFGDFKVLSITGDHVTVKGPDGVTVLRSDVNYRGGSGNSTPPDKTLPGGIDLDLIKVPLPSAATWIGPPMVN